VGLVEADQIAWLVHWCWVLMCIGGCGVGGLRLLDCFSGHLMAIQECLDMFQCCWYSGVGDGELCMGMEAVGDEEWGLASGCLGGIVVCELGKR
jgi:hypothetical protein